MADNNISNGKTEKTQSLVGVPHQQKHLKIVFQNLVQFWNQHGLISQSGRSQTAPGLTRSTNYYPKNAEDRLQEINENLSNMLENSTKEIDRICGKVRQCLSQMDDVNKSTISLGTTDEVSVIESLDGENGEKPLDDDAQKTLQPFITIISEDNTIKMQKNDFPRPVTAWRNKFSLANNIEQQSPLIFEQFKRALIKNEDEYEVMDRIIENLNEDIANLSVTSLHKQIGNVKENINVQQESDSECGNENEIATAPPIKTSLMKVIPDVYARPGTTNLHEKLLIQIEANDSFICFQKMMMQRRYGMKKKLKKSSQHVKQLDMPIKTQIIDTTLKKISSSTIPLRKQSKYKDLSAKYIDSLWFSEKHKIRSKNKKSKKTINTQQFHAKLSNVSIKSPMMKMKRKHSTNFNRMSSKMSMISNRSIQNDMELKHCQSARSTKEPKSNRVQHCNKSKSTNFASPMYCLQYKNNSNSLNPVAKCRYRWIEAKAHLAPVRRLQFLDILDDLTNKDLEPLKSEYPRKDNMNVWKKNVKDTYLYKLVNGGVNLYNSWTYLLQAKGKHSNYKKKSKVFSGNHEREHEVEDTGNELQIFNNCALSRTEVVKKLSSYIYDPDNERQYYHQTMIVMPVTVLYDNSKFEEMPVRLQAQKLNNNNNINVQQKLPLKPLKEPKVISNRATWHPPKLSKLIKNSNTEKHGPTNVNQSKVKATECKTPIKKRIISKSFPPIEFSKFQAQEYKIVPLDHGSSEIATVTKVPEVFITKKKQISHENPSSDQTNIKKTPVVKERNTLDIQKLWANKYKKPINRQLVNFLQKQPVLPNQQQIPNKNGQTVLKVQTKNLTADNNNLTDLDYLKNLKDRQQMKIPKSKQQINRKNDEKTNKKMTEAKTVKQGPQIKKNTLPHKRMLDQLRGLKEKNTVIQDNIQKAINVIESKMIHLLSNSTGNSNSVEAFNCMEKEITHVLSMMKCDGQKQIIQIPQQNAGINEECKPEEVCQTKKTLEEEFDMISDQVFTKLNNILEVSRSRSSTINKEGTGEKHGSEYSEQPLEVTMTAKKMVKAPTTPLTAVRKERNEQKTKFSNINNDLKQSSSDEQSDNATRQDCCGDGSNSLDEKDKTLSLEEFSDNSKGDYFNENNKEIIIKDNNIDVIIKEEEIRTNNNVTPVATVKISPKKEDANDETDTEDSLSFSEHVNKIIKRVEDIYTHLDDIQADNVDDVDFPHFTDQVKTTINVKSEEFLTPFMQAVKCKRGGGGEHAECIQKTMLSRSPSFYNVLSFLDTLGDIREDTAMEVHITRLYNYIQVWYIPKTINYSRIIHTTKYQVEKSSCLKKCNDDNVSKVNKKKVSFLVMQDDKCNQAILCPVHMSDKSLEFDDNMHRDEHINSSCEQYENILSTEHLPQIEYSKNDVKNCNNISSIQHLEEHFIEPIECCGKNVTNEMQIEQKNDTENSYNNDTSEDIQIPNENDTKDQDIIDDDYLYVSDYLEMSKSDDKTTQVYHITKNTNKKKQPAPEEIDKTNKNKDKNIEGNLTTCDNQCQAPHINIFYDEYDENIPKVILNTKKDNSCTERYIKVKNFKGKTVKVLPKVVVFRDETSNIFNKNRYHQLKSHSSDSAIHRRYLKELSFVKRQPSTTTIICQSKLQQQQQNVDVYFEENRELLLKSVYALVYVIMFTALNMEYRCS